MTLREIALLFRALEARRARQERLLWMNAAYTAAAVHCPGKLPCSPGEKEKSGGVMSPEQMKRNLKGGL